MKALFQGAVSEVPVKSVTPENASQPGRFRDRNGNLPPSIHLQLLEILLPHLLLLKLPFQWTPHILQSVLEGRINSPHLHLLVLRAKNLPFSQQPSLLGWEMATFLLNKPIA